MRRSELEAKYLKLKPNGTFKSYKQQKNYCSRLQKKERRSFFENLNLSFVVDNKKFWKVVKSLFNEKGSGVSNEVVLLEKDKILRDDNEVAKEFHSYFNSIVSSLGITENKYRIQKNILSSRPIDQVIMKFQFHLSILLIKSNINSSNSFSWIYSKNTDKSLDECRQVQTIVDECRRVTKRVQASHQTSVDKCRRVQTNQKIFL